MKRTRFRQFLVKSALFTGCLIPLLILGWNVWRGRLSANPISDITNETGIWTFRLIVATLAFTPVRRITGWHSLIKQRRMVGLFAFFYGTLHFATYLWLDQFFDWSSIVKDIPKRPFITVGFASFALMIPLAVTSTQRMIRWIGGRRWDLLHRSVYFTAVGACVHYIWLVKVVTYRQVFYATMVAALLLVRLLWKIRTTASSALRKELKEGIPAAQV